MRRASRRGGSPRSPTALVAATLATLALQACVFLPRTILLPDPQCRGMQKQMILEGTQVAAIQGCVNNGCAALVAAAGIVTATTAIVSGSIVIVGNVVYWIERQASCDERRGS